jgi:hypothetical protein
MSHAKLPLDERLFRGREVRAIVLKKLFRR